MIDKLTKNLLEEIANLHEIPNGAVSFRKNGKSEVMSSTPDIEIKAKDNGQGINVFIHSSCQNEACHLPVIVTEEGYFDLVYNDFYIEDNAVVTIVAGCGVHSAGEAGHNGIHSFHIGKNANVVYVENHVALGEGNNKTLNTITNVDLGENSTITMNLTQLGGVDFADRKTTVRIKNNSSLIVNEKILTDKFNVAKTDFKVDLVGENSKCDIVSRSVARDESEQSFKSNLIGKNLSFGHVECDAIVLDNAIVSSTPKVVAKDNRATLTHEASIGKIASEQLVKLMTLGLNEKQAETKIIEGFLK